MNKNFLKRVIAQSPSDLQFISACCSEGKVKLSEIKYLPQNKLFLLSIERLNKENFKSKKKIKSIIKFEFIDSSKSKNIDQKDPKLTLELLTIELLKKDRNYQITLLFSNNAFITLSAEIIEVTLEDQRELNDKSI